MVLHLRTDGAGFIGSNRAGALIARGERIRVLDELSVGRLEKLPPGAEFIKGCITDAALVRGTMQGVAGRFHLAAIASVAGSNEARRGKHRANQASTIAATDATRAEGPALAR
ncbi:NAD-dependent epimerase/dehydratase family protein [Roseococcus sp. SDR]|uniref:NAD-dependent epimerase/dehydratase family protein n=1 Tax=Roseococcus sp. SDR TaxID=2835532 RepID=UPI001BCB2196|nr:NAD-dependent epimerase/dehydratase family protein [Roseococcus sp. SDR]MBS7789292.1 NAD-dependent epimerase/dehydratase family protein [Roseococcus sp. SDR]MBV1844606.1 NAD-dependent epimerase/dehydratase family protein [Roseococcus sp. SDR]